MGRNSALGAQQRPVSAQGVNRAAIPQRPSAFHPQAAALELAIEETSQAFGNDATPSNIKHLRFLFIHAGVRDLPVEGYNEVLPTRVLKDMYGHARALLRTWLANGTWPAEGPASEYLDWASLGAEALVLSGAVDANPGPVDMGAGPSNYEQLAIPTPPKRSRPASLTPYVCPTPAQAVTPTPAQSDGPAAKRQATGVHCPICGFFQDRGFLLSVLGLPKSS